MARAKRPVVAGRWLRIALLGLATGACSMGGSASSGARGDDTASGNYGGASYPNVAADGGFSSGGSLAASGGAGGFSSSGSSGTSAAGGSSASAGSSGSGGDSADSPSDAGAASMDASAPYQPCQVDIEPVSAASLLDLPAGATSTVRVHGVIVGQPQPTQPQWMWTVTALANNLAIAFAPVANDPSTIDIPLVSTGSYSIHATVSTNPVCDGTKTASATDMPRASYWVRVTPPSQGNANPAPPLDTDVTVLPGKPPPRGLTMPLPYNLTITPQGINGLSRASYVRISSPMASWTREGDTTINGEYLTSINADARAGSPFLYDLLVVPDPIAGQPDLPPLYWPQQTAQQLGSTPIVVDSGVAVAGRVQNGNTAVAGATVLMRAGTLTSTIGTSANDGQFQIAARPGQFGALVLPAAGTGLPEAHLDAGSGFALPVGTSPSVTLNLTWATAPIATLTLHVTTSSGAPASGTAVRVQSNDGALPNVGTFGITVPPAAAITRTAYGVVNQQKTTDATGTVIFSGLPRASYTATLVPSNANDGVTTAAIDLGNGDLTNAIAQSALVMLSGHVTSAPTGSTIIVLADKPVIGRALPTAAVNATGAFAVPVDQNQRYHLVLDPGNASTSSRVPLGPVDVTTTNLDIGTRVTPNPLVWNASVFASDGVSSLAGALVQVFCLGIGPDCLDNTRPAATATLPLVEGVTDDQGLVTLPLPDPATPTTP